MHMLHVTHLLHILYWIKSWTPAYTPARVEATSGSPCQILFGPVSVQSGTAVVVFVAFVVDVVEEVVVVLDIDAVVGVVVGAVVA